MIRCGYYGLEKTCRIGGVLLELWSVCPETHGHQQKTKLFEKKEFCISPVKFEMPNVDTKLQFCV